MTSISINRDPAFWTSLAEEPMVRSRLLGLSPDAVGHIATLAQVAPYASAHGGFLLWRLDALGRGWDLHALYGSASSRRERHLAGCELLEEVLSEGPGAFVTVNEVAQIGSSRPPKSFGFRLCAEEFDDAKMGATPVQIRTWIVTRDAWREAPARVAWRLRTLN